jgi:hypothetical protein
MTRSYLTPLAGLVLTTSILADPPETVRFSGAVVASGTVARLLLTPVGPDGQPLGTPLPVRVDNQGRFSQEIPRVNYQFSYYPPCGHLTALKMDEVVLDVTPQDSFASEKTVPDPGTYWKVGFNWLAGTPVGILTFELGGERMNRSVQSSNAKLNRTRDNLSSLTKSRLDSNLMSQQSSSLSNSKRQEGGGHIVSRSLACGPAEELSSTDSAVLASRK